MAVLLSFWGKGGTGKSTLAAAAAYLLAGRGLRVLAVSTDLSPSLGLLLCGRRGVKWETCGGVEVFEADEEDVKRMWVERFGDEVYEVASSLLPVGREIVDYVAGAPGIADQYTMYLVYSLATGGGYDVVVWDTAAAGGSLRLLRIEEEVYRHMGEAARLYLRLRSSLERLRGRRSGQGKTPLELIEEWRRLAASILGFLQGSGHRLHVVAAPDRLSVETTRSLIEEFQLHGIRPQALLVNQVVDPAVCPDCRPWVEDAALQEEALRELKRLRGDAVLCTVPRLERRPVDPRGLEEIAGYIEPCIKTR